MEGNQTESAKEDAVASSSTSKPNTLPPSSDFNSPYKPTRNINISKPISLTNSRVLSLLEYHGATFDTFDSRCIDTFYGLYATDIVLFHCKINGEYTTLTQKEFLDPITKEVSLDYFSQNNFGAYKRYYDISSSRYTGEVFLEGMVRLATINGTTREKDYVYLIWKQRNGEYFYLSYIHYMSLTPSEKKFLVNFCPLSPVDFPDKSYSKLVLE